MKKETFERDFWEEFGNLEEYIEINEKCLDREFEESKTRLQTIYKSILEMNGDSTDSESKSKEIVPFTDMIPIFHRTYIFLLLYNFIECQLYAIGEIKSNEDIESIRQEDLKGRGIKRSRLFFIKVLNIKKPFENAAWKNFEFYNELRNIIVHRNGKMDSIRDQQIISQLNRYEGINLSYQKEIMFDNNFIRKVLTEIYTFFQSILIALKKSV